MIYYSILFSLAEEVISLAGQLSTLVRFDNESRINDVLFKAMAIGTLVTLIIIGACGPARSQVTVPAVSCSGDWDQTRVPLPIDGKIGVSFSSSVASRFEMYLYDTGMMLGPRSWHCSESIRATFIAIRIYPSSGGQDGPGISMQAWVGEDPWANQSIIQLAGRYFPSIIDSQYVINLLNDDPDLASEKVLGAQKFLVPAYSTDQLKYLNSSELEFVTPSGKIGLGAIAFDANGDTKSRQTSSLETVGVVCLVDEPRPAYQLLMFSIRLSKKDSDLLGAIQRYGANYFTTFSKNNCPQI